MPADSVGAQLLYEQVYCARGNLENRIKEQQLWLFVDRTSTATMPASQRRLYFSTFAGALMTLLRRFDLSGTALTRATANTIHMRILKIGARITVNRCQIRIAFASVYPLQSLFAHVLAGLRPPAPPDRPPTAGSDALTKGAADGLCPASDQPPARAESGPGDPSPAADSGLQDLRSVIPDPTAGRIGAQPRSVSSGAAPFV